jgi:hypothetical protein
VPELNPGRDPLRALAALPNGSLRQRAAARILGGFPAEEGAKLIDLALRRLRHGAPSEVGAATALVQAILPENGMSYEERSELYTCARELGLLAATLFLSPPAHREAPAPRAGIEATLSLGHRKALARTASAEAFVKLGAEKDARVAQELLKNPRLTEREVLRLASLRPAQPEVLLAIAQNARFSTRLPVRTALARNPYSPTSLAFQLLPHLSDVLLREIGQDATLHPQVRQFAAALLAAG